MIDIIAYRVIFNGTSRLLKEQWTVDDLNGLELLRASLKAKYKAMYIDFVYRITLKNNNHDKNNFRFTAL